MPFPVVALAAFSSFVAPTGRCIKPPVPTRTVSPTAQEKIDAPVVAAVAAMAVAGVVLPDVGQLDSGFQYDSWAATAVAIPATICILIPFFGANGDRGPSHESACACTLRAGRVSARRCTIVVH